MIEHRWVLKKTKPEGLECVTVADPRNKGLLYQVLQQRHNDGSYKTISSDMTRVTYHEVWTEWKDVPFAGIVED